MAKKITKIILSLLILILLAIWVEIVRSPSDNSVHLYFFNVGQGDSELIQKGDYQILIDGGPDDSILAQIGQIMPLGDRKIEIIILTHPHSDHLIGLNLILERYQVGKIYLSGAVHTSNQYLEFLQKIKDKNIETIVPQINQTEKPFDDASLAFLWPGDRYQEKTTENLNNASLISRFCYLEQCTIYLGDQETDEQEMMFAQNQKANYQAQILKISHHGSSNGTNRQTLDKIKPSYAVIEAGADNQYGHPHAVVLNLLDNASVRMFRTDRDGRLEFLFSDSGISLGR